MPTTFANSIDSNPIYADRAENDKDGNRIDQTYAKSASLATVATTGDYDDLTDKPDLSIYAESSNLATVATTGSYDDLVDKPTIPAAQVNSDWNASSGVAEILNKPTLSTVATTGDYNDLVNKPSIPAAQINSDWSESDTTSKAYIQNKPDLSVYATSSELTAGLATKQDTISDLATIRSGASAGATAVQPSDLATVATTGDYDDLIDKPTIPSGVQLVPAATSSDASKVLTVDAQGTPAWAASQGLFVAQYGVTTYAQVVAAIEANKIVYCRIGADWDDSRMAFLAYDAHIGPNNNVEFQYVRSNGSSSGYDSIFVYKVNSSGWTTEERSVKAGNISYPVTQVNVNGSSAMTGTVANITIPAAPTVDQTYDATSSNAQSGVAVAGAISTKQDTISDLATIRSGAADGATAVQPSDLATVATTGAYSDLSGTPTIPTVDQSYSAASTNAQSGVAVAQAISAVNQVPASTSSDANKVLKVNASGTPEWAVGGGGGTYTAGTGIDIDQNNAISVENPLPSATSADEGKVLKVDANGDPEWATGGGGTQVQSDWTESDNSDPSYIQNKPTVMGLTAGSNVTITEGVSNITIAATDTTYTAGTGISITNGAISNSDPLPSHTSTESGKVLGVDSNGGLGWVNQSGGGTTYTAGNMISLANSEIAVSTTAGITDIQQVSALPASPVATVLYLIPET